MQNEIVDEWNDGAILHNETYRVYNERMSYWHEDAIADNQNMEMRIPDSFYNSYESEHLKVTC